MKKLKITLIFIIILSLIITTCACVKNDYYYLQVGEYWVLTSIKPTEGNYYAFSSDNIEHVIEKIVVYETAKRYYLQNNIQNSDIELIYSEQPQHMKYEIRHYRVGINSSTSCVSVRMDPNKTLYLIDVD